MAMQAYEDAMVEAGHRVVHAVCEGMGVEMDAFSCSRGQW